LALHVVDEDADEGDGSQSVPGEIASEGPHCG
jgi:hypothetical protein